MNSSEEQQQTPENIDIHVKEPEHEKSSNTSDSNTQVDFRLEGPRATCSFKGNRKLWKEFVKYSKANYGSVCHIMEPFEIAMLTSKVNLSHTIKPLTIENLNVSRVVKRVRRCTEEEEEIEAVEAPVCVVCGKDAYVRVTDGRYLCRGHLDKEKPKLRAGGIGWRELCLTV